MAYWNCHALEVHANETEIGNFVSPVTNEVITLTWAQSKIAETILRRLPTTESNPWGQSYAWVVTNSTLSAWVGKYISPPLYAKAIWNLELAGIFEVTREIGEGHKITIGRLLRCDLDQCQDPLHYPGNYPLPKVSTPSVIVRGEINETKETPLVRLDIKNLNNPLRTLNTISESSKEFEALEIVAAEVTQANELRAVTRELETPKLLPNNWEAWTWARARVRGLEQPSPADIGYAWHTFEETGLDLETGGAWQDGRPNPKPATQLKTGTN